MSSSSVSGYCNPESSKVKGFAQIEKTLFEWYSFFVGDKSAAPSSSSQKFSESRSSPEINFVFSHQGELR